MAKFPRTMVGGCSVSRLIIGTNWFLGFSHRTPAKDGFIKEHMDEGKITEILVTFFNAGVDSIMGPLSQYPFMDSAIKRAEDRTGVGCIRINTPFLNVADTDAARAEAARTLDRVAALGTTLCLPHHSCVEQLVDRGSRTIRRLEYYTGLIRERNMIPGLSAHMPEVVVYADQMEADVETYIQIYNPIGFLMQLEVEWVARIIHQAKKPVMTTKPMAAGRVTPFVGLNFVWNTIREQDMVTVGTMSPREAAEVVEHSLAALERRFPLIGSRGTPSKQTIISKE